MYFLFLSSAHNSLFILVNKTKQIIWKVNQRVKNNIKVSPLFTALNIFFLARLIFSFLSKNSLHCRVVMATLITKQMMIVLGCGNLSISVCVKTKFCMPESLMTGRRQNKLYPVNMSHYLIVVTNFQSPLHQGGLFLCNPKGGMYVCKGLLFSCHYTDFSVFC